MAEKQRWKPVCFALRFPADYWPASGRTGSLSFTPRPGAACVRLRARREMGLIEYRR